MAQNLKSPRAMNPDPLKKGVIAMALRLAGVQTYFRGIT